MVSRYKERDGSWTAWKREATGTSHTIPVSKAAWTSRYHGRNVRADYQVRLVATDSGGKSSEDLVAVWLLRSR